MLSRAALWRATLVVATLAILAALHPARAESCGELWYARNSIYKEAGYCFRTPRAIRAFGNAGCSFDDVSAVPLSARQRAIVDDIVRQERFQGCSG